MKKFLLSFLLATSVFAQGDPPPYVKGQSQSGLGNLGSTIQVPKNQSTKLNSYQARIETGNTNELRNPSFEGSPYNSGWTCSLGTMSQGVGPDGSKALSVVSTGTGFRCRQTFTSSADLKGTLARFYARIKTAAPDVKICGLDGGILTANEVGCVTVNPTNANKVFDDPSGFFRYGDTLYGIVIYTNNAAVFPTVIDDASMGAAGLTTATIQGDTVYSALSSFSGSLSRLSKSGWITFSSLTDTSLFAFNLIGFNDVPNCGVVAVGPGDTANYTVKIASVTSTSLVVRTGFSSTTFSYQKDPISFSIICEKSGADYANSSSSGILSSNATIVKAGEIVATSSASCSADMLPANGAAVSRTQYAELFAEIGITHGQGNGTTTFNVPDYRGYILRGVDGTAGRDPDKASRTAMNTGGNTGNNVGSVQTDQYASHNHSLNLFGGSPSGTGVYIGVLGLTYNTTSNLTTSGAIGNTGGNETRPKNAYVNYCVRTKGSNLAIIPLAGSAMVPGYFGQVDMFSFDYGTTNASTVCSASPCSYLTQNGSIVSSLARNSLANYTANFNKTYSKVYCTGSVRDGANYLIATGAGRTFSCTNCNSINFITGNNGVGGLDSYGTISCTGTY